MHIYIYKDVYIYIYNQICVYIYNMEVWLSSPGIEQRGAHEPQPFPMAGLQRPQLRGCPGPRRTSKGLGDEALIVPNSG